ncbi:hypothetical protein QOZ80_2BG0178780 [Eleusine coracana subsp. coracana]|nr:hypothetical protein QOZ80_2BG0178780 [Eleusine coracana subsp. coracana]
MEADDEERPLLRRDNGASPKHIGTGKWRACVMILGTELSEVLAFAGIARNLVTYLTDVVHESNVVAAADVSTWMGTCFLTPLLGAFLADSYWGRYKTILIFLSVYTLGLITLALSAWLATILSMGLRRAVVFLGLFLVALGVGGIKPCVSPFGAEQFDDADPGERDAKASFFNCSKKVAVAAVRNRNIELPRDSSFLHDKRNSLHKIEHTDEFTFLDKAAVVSSGKAVTEEAASPWNLCTVTQVEEVKMLLRLCSVWPTVIFFFTVTSQMSTTFLEQGKVMDNRIIGTFSVPPAIVSSIEVVSILLCIPAYEAVLLPLACRITGKERGITLLQRLGIGLVLATLTMAYVALLEMKRLQAASPVSIIWQAPAYFVLGAAEVFTSVGLIEFFYDQSPDTMKSLCTAMSLVAVSAGNYLNSLIIAVLAWATTWIPEDLNQGRLDCFFWMMAVLSSVNMLAFLCSAMRYNYRGK